MTLKKQLDIFQAVASSTLDCEPACTGTGTQNTFTPKKQDKKRIKNKGSNKVCCQ